MDEYISKKAILQHLNNCKEDPLFDPDMARICFAIGIFIENMKPADVQPVKHGEWIWDSNAPHREYGAYRCNRCGCHSKFTENYCYNCGAKMSEDGDTNETD